MPTGYTAKLMAEGQSFRDFVLTCARAFGACIELRDEPLSSDIPVFRPSSYSTNSLNEARRELAELKAFSDKQKHEFGVAKRKEQIAATEKSLEKYREENARLEEMEHYVNNWTPPTDEHKELKKFMLEQINVSKHDLSYSERSLATLKQKPPLLYYQTALEVAEDSIKYYTKQIEKEAVLIDNRNEWVEQLKNSLR